LTKFYVTNANTEGVFRTVRRRRKRFGTESKDWFLVFYIHGSVHGHSVLIRSNKKQQMQVF